MCNSSDNGIWVHDQLKNVLIKLSKEGTVQSSSEDLVMLTGISVNPEFMAEKDNQVFLRDENGTFFIFDNMGSFDTNFCVGDLDFCGFSNGMICYLEENELYAQYPSDWNRTLLHKFEQLPDFIRVNEKFLYYFTSGELHQIELGKKK